MVIDMHVHPALFSDICGDKEPEQMYCPGRTGYILESRRSRPETTISNSAIRKARTETETHNRFIDKTSNRVVYFEK